jgi:hypothetical protein
MCFFVTTETYSLENILDNLPVPAHAEPVEDSNDADDYPKRILPVGHEFYQKKFDLDEDTKLGLIRNALKSLGARAPQQAKKAELIERLNARWKGEDYEYADVQDRWTWNPNEMKIAPDAGEPRPRPPTSLSVPAGGVSRSFFKKVKGMKVEDAVYHIFGRILNDEIFELLRIAANQKLKFPSSATLSDNIDLEFNPPNPEELSDEEESEMFYNPVDNEVPEDANVKIDKKIGEAVTNTERWKKYLQYYIALHLADCLCPLPKMEDHWNEFDPLGIGMQSSVVRHIMSRTEFRSVRSLITLGRNSAAYKRLFTALNESFSEAWTPVGHCALDEMCCPFAGRGPVLYNPSKPHKFHIKLHCLSDSKHYIMRTFPHIVRGEKHSVSSLLKDCDSLLTTLGCKDTGIFADSWYGSIDSANLCMQLGRPFTFSLKSNAERLLAYFAKDLDSGYCRVAQNLLPKQHRRRANRMTLVTFKDQGKNGKERKAFHLISNMYGPRPSGEPGREMRPSVVMHYNAYMGSVDRVDQTILNYFESRSLKSWKLRLFHHVIHQCIQNARVIFENVYETTIPKRKFMEMLVPKLMGSKYTTFVQSCAPQPPLKYHSISGNHSLRVCTECGDGRTSYKCDCDMKPRHPVCAVQHVQVRPKKSSAKRSK